MSRGFIPPFGRDAEAMSHRIGDAIWITLGGEDRLLPGAVVNDELGKRIAAMEEKEGRKLGGRARKRLKEDLVMELLPRAFVRPVQTNATLDLEHGFIAVDASSKKAAESVVSELRHALGSFPALPLNAEVSARAVLTGWIAGEELPAGLVLGDECELKDPIDGGAVVKCQRQELLCDEIKKHLESGKQVSKLALVLDDHVSFVLGEDLVVRKLKFLDGVVDQLEGTERDGLHAELDARYALMAGELKRLFAVLEPALKLSPADA
jgi:recombination associated protein RdgC